MTSNLTHSPADVVRWLLIQGSQGASPNVLPLADWPVYVGVEPSQPDEVITLADTTGQSDGRDMVNGALNQHYGLQFRFRSWTAVDGWTKAMNVRTWLSESVRQTSVYVGSNNYLVECLAKFGQVIKLGVDAPSTKRWLHTLNCFVSLRQTI